MRTLTLTLLAFLAFPSLGLAQTYMTPEEVLHGSAETFMIPSRKRGAQWWADLQAQQNKERHPSTVTDPWERARAAQSNLPAPTQTVSEPIAPPVTSDIGTDPLVERLLDRLLAQPPYYGGPILSSTAGFAGAPLAGTGPAEILAALALIGATLWTIKRARGLEKFVKE